VSKKTALVALKANIKHIENDMFFFVMEALVQFIKAGRCVDTHRSLFFSFLNVIY